MSKRILLTSGRHFVTLHLARVLSSAGHTVFVSETSYWQLCRYSRSVQKTFVVPPPRTQPQEHIEALTEIIQSNAIDYLIPTCEDTLFISSALDRLPCDVLCDPFQKVHALHHKWEFQQLVSEAGLPSVESHLICNEQDLSKIPREKSYIVKPCYSRAAQGLSQIKPRAPLPKLRYDSNNPWIAQRFLTGKKYCCYAIAHQGEVAAEGIYPVLYAIDDSSCVFFKAIRHQKIEEWIHTFCSHHQTTGQISFDFIEESDGTLYAIECNPRSTSGAHLFSLSDKLAHALLGKNSQICRPEEGHSRQVRTGMLLYGWKGQTLGEFFKHVVSVQDVLYEPSDPWPAVVQPILLGKYVKDSLKHRISLPAAFTHDLDWDASQLNEKQAILPVH